MSRALGMAIMAASAAIVVVSCTMFARAADMGDGPSSSACIPNTIRAEQMQAWDFMAAPSSALQAKGFRLAHVVRTVAINDTGALPVVLGLPFGEAEQSAVATGLGRAACVCIRAGSNDYAATIRRNAEARGGSFGNAFRAAVEQCLNPVQFFTGEKRGVNYGNVSPTKIGTPAS